MRGFARVLTVVAGVSCVAAQGRDAYMGSLNDPAIAYETGPLNDVVTRLNEQVASGSTRLAFDGVRGYLPAVLRALAVPVESQVAVYSQTSLQAPLISAHNPRTVYFNDHVAVGFVPGGDVLEIAAQDPVRGVIFYRLAQNEQSTPRFERSRECLRCHIAWETFAVPGFTVLSTGPDDAAGYATGGAVDDTDRIATRWGGWYVTGPKIPKPNLGTAVSAAPWLADRIDVGKYPTPHSDVVALMVLEHQARAMNFITYLGWETRAGVNDARIDAIARELVSYFTFADEAPLPAPVQGSSAFASRFTAEGRRDSKGRSLRDLELSHRLMRYRCSYMIDTAAFDALPERAKTAVVDRLVPALRERDPAALEILKETKPELFKSQSGQD